MAIIIPLTIIASWGHDASCRKGRVDKVCDPVQMLVTCSLSISLVAWPNNPATHYQSLGNTLRNLVHAAVPAANTVAFTRVSFTRAFLVPAPGSFSITAFATVPSFSSVVSVSISSVVTAPFASVVAISVTFLITATALTIVLTAANNRDHGGAISYRFSDNRYFADRNDTSAGAGGNNGANGHACA
ncbi:TPA: hypothetical protein ACLEB8_005141 [Pseudomonas aeruginosa]